MSNDQFSPLSGFRDLLGPTKPWLIGELTAVFRSFGYQALETPSIERQEILLGKLGEDSQKQLYLFEDNGKRRVGLRYDLTVPLSRYVAANIGNIILPFKRFEIGSLWRAEKPQKGRYRQFTQGDIDIIGAPEPASEVELLLVIKAIADRLKLKLVCQFNDRRLVASIFEELRIPSDKRLRLLQLLDKKEKLTEAEFTNQFTQLGLSDVERRQINGLFLAPATTAFTEIERLVSHPAVLSLKNLITFAKSIGLSAEFVPGMVRGLDYYTGTLIECQLDGYSGGTIMAGGRYDNLIEN